MSRPLSATESYLIDRWRKQGRVNPLWVALRGAIVLGIPLTFCADLMRAAASDTRPDFGASAMVCIPIAIFTALASRWIIGRLLNQATRKQALDNEEDPASISTRRPDSP